MTESDSLEALRADLDYQELVESASPPLRLYIRTLEQENARLRQELLETRQRVARRQRTEARPERASAPVVLRSRRYPEDVMVISRTALGQVKRTPLNEYSTQRRGGIGVFDIQTGRDDVMTQLLVARESAGLLVISNRGRAFRVPVQSLPLTEVRARGSSLPERLMFTEGETIGAMTALDEEHDSRNTVLVATTNGWLWSLHRNYVGPRLQPGTLLSDPRRGGEPSAITLSSGSGDVLVALRSGLAYRFSESLVRREGVRGIQVRPDDAMVGIAAVSGDDAQVLLVTADGLSTRRILSGFRANKSPGGQGKVIMKTDALAGLSTVTETDEVLCATGLAKVIRFAASEVPAKTGPVQGVAAMDCRGDALMTLAVIPAPAEDD